MTKKEYRKIMQEMSERKFQHEFSSITDIQPEQEVIDVISMQNVFSVLRKHVRKKRKTSRKIQINIK